jgi:hypothetical protein
MIENVQNVKSNDIDIYQHIITYSDGKVEHVKFNKKEEDIFIEKYEYMQLNKPIINYRKN